MPTDHADYERGLAVGLERARELVMGAPSLLHGQRKAGGPGGVPRIIDRAVDADGDPDYVHNSYVLRDAVLHWIEKDLARLDGASILPRYAPQDVGDSGVSEAGGVSDGPQC